MTTTIPAGWKLVEALRESLLWTASSLAAVGKEQDLITLEGRKRTIGEILDEANAALDAPSLDCVAPGVSMVEDAQDMRSATHGMPLGERIAHVGGRTNARGYIEFGSPMAVNALIQHVLRDIDCTRQEDDGAYQARYRLPGGQWSSWGHVVCGVKGHEQELRYLPGERCPAPASGDAQLAAALMPKLQSLLDRMANDPRTGAMFEADGDTLRDAMHLCRSVKVCAAGDALDAARLDWLEQHDGRFYNKDRISSIVGTGFLVAGDEQGARHQTVRAAIDAAIAAQRKGDA